MTVLNDAAVALHEIQLAHLCVQAISWPTVLPGIMFTFYTKLSTCEDSIQPIHKHFTFQK